MTDGIMLLMFLFLWCLLHRQKQTHTCNVKDLNNKIFLLQSELTYIQKRLTQLQEAKFDRAYEAAWESENEGWESTENDRETTEYWEALTHMLSPSCRIN